MRFNFWMQKGFAAQGARLFKLVPTASVARKHVRLDVRILRTIFESLDGKNVLLKELKDMEKKTAGEHGCVHPSNFMLPEAPPKKQKKTCESEEEWAEYKQRGEEHNECCNQIKATDAWKAQLARHMQHQHLQAAYVSSFFRNLPRQPKKGEEEKKKKKKMKKKKGSAKASPRSTRPLTFDCSLMTDGVAVSLQYSYKVPKARADGEDKKKGKAGKQKKSLFEDLEHVDTYDRHLDMVDPVAEEVTVGADPGRSNIGTFAVVTRYVWDVQANKLVEGDSPQRKTWKLTRRSYRIQSGIVAYEKLKAARTASLHAAWSDLARDEAALRTCHATSIGQYVVNCLPLWSQWWPVVLERRDAKAKLRVYSGKRHALDGFFARVLRDVKTMFPTLAINVAYGSAGVTMLSGGKGEVSVPTTGAYHSCRRIFGNKHVSAIPEFNSTKVKWETGQVKHRVYKRYFVREEAGPGGMMTPMVREQLCSIKPGSITPRLDPSQLALMEMMNVKRLERNRSFKTCQPWVQVVPRFPEVRGLRFCPETRMYYDRDIEAAIAIGRLSILRRRGQVPTCFAPVRATPCCQKANGAKTSSTRTRTQPKKVRRS